MIHQILILDPHQGRRWRPQPDAASSSVPLRQSLPLVSGSCTAVRQRGVILLDWNPTFDPSWTHPRGCCSQPAAAALPKLGIPIPPYLTNSIGNGIPMSIEPPYLGINFIIALQGIFPSRS